MICFGRQPSEVNFYLHDNSGQLTGIISHIVDDMRGVEYSVLQGTKVGAGPEHSFVGISS
jgi:hypothetical protein